MRLARPEAQQPKGDEQENRRGLLRAVLPMKGRLVSVDSPTRRVGSLRLSDLPSFLLNIQKPTTTPRLAESGSRFSITNIKPKSERPER
jgi:hypothetical protein